ADRVDRARNRRPTATHGARRSARHGRSRPRIAGNDRVSEGGQGLRRRCLQYVDEIRSEEHTSELQSLRHLVCRLLLEKKKHRITNAVPNGNQLTSNLPFPACITRTPTTSTFNAHALRRSALMLCTSSSIHTQSTMDVN